MLSKQSIKIVEKVIKSANKNKCGACFDGLIIRNNIQYASDKVRLLQIFNHIDDVPYASDQIKSFDVEALITNIIIDNRFEGEVIPLEKFRIEEINQKVKEISKEDKMPLVRIGTKYYNWNYLLDGLKFLGLPEEVTVYHGQRFGSGLLLENKNIGRYLLMEVRPRNIDELPILADLIY